MATQPGKRRGQARSSSKLLSIVTEVVAVTIHFDDCEGEDHGGMVPDNSNSNLNFMGIVDEDGGGPMLLHFRIRLSEGKQVLVEGVYLEPA